MIKIEHTDVFGFDAAIRGMRNPLNSWAKSDSGWIHHNGIGRIEPEYQVGENDLALMKKLSAAGSDHAKFLRMISTTCDITAPMFWWMEFDTYKVGTVRNSCSKMHKIHVKPFCYDDFTHEGVEEVTADYPNIRPFFQNYIDMVDWLRVMFNETQEKRFWRALIEMLPESFNMRATVQQNYQVLKAQHAGRRHHKLTEWHDYCDWAESLPYFKEVVLNGNS